MTFLPPVPIDAPVPRGKRYGLLTAANGPFDFPDVHAAGGGLVYEPISCGTTRDYPVVCGPEDESPDDSPGEFDKVFDPDEPRNTVDPFQLYASLVCGTAGKTPEQIERRLRLRAENGEQTGVERNFALQLAASAAPELAPPDMLNLTSVIGTLEQWLYGDKDVPTTTAGVSAAGAQYGNIGYLHAPPRVAAYAAEHHLLFGSGTKGDPWRTPMGTIWAFGGGYSGAAPGAAAAPADADFIYITGQVTVWREPEWDIPSLDQTLDRATNQWTGIAERTYAVAYDCDVAAAEFRWPL